MPALVGTGVLDFDDAAGEILIQEGYKISREAKQAKNEKTRVGFLGLLGMGRDDLMAKAHR